MKVSLDFELEYDIANADQVSRLTEAVIDAALVALKSTPDVKITKTTQRVAGFYPDLMN